MCYITVYSGHAWPLFFTMNAKILDSFQSNFAQGQNTWDFETKIIWTILNNYSHLNYAVPFLWPQLMKAHDQTRLLSSVRIIFAFFEENGIFLEGLQGYKIKQIRILSSCETKSMWRIYNTACRASDKQTISYQKFIQLWDELHLEVVVTKPQTDIF